MAVLVLLDVDGARNNLGLGKIQNANFGGVFVDTCGAMQHYITVVIIASTLYNAHLRVSGSIGRLYTEIQSDGIPKTTNPYEW